MSASGRRNARVDLVSDLSAPFYIGHRGGHLLYPEHSMEGYRACARDGYVVEPDVQLTSDGVLVCLHDGTVDRTTNGTGAVSGMTAAQWRALRVDPQIPGGHEALPAEWLPLLDELGGRALLTSEIKTPAARDPLLDSIAARDLHRAVIVQSFDYADVQAAADRGIAACFLSDTADPATLAADGIELLGCSTGASGAYIAAAKAAGLTVIVYTVNTVAAANTALANGADGLFSDDPEHLTGRRLKRHRDPFADKVLWAGADPDPTYARFRRADEFGMDGGGVLGVGHYWAGTRGPRLRVRWRVQYATWSGTDLTRWGGSMYVGTNPDADTEYQDNNTGAVNGYHGFLRRNGSLELYRVSNGTPTQLAVLAASAPSVPAADEGAPTDLELVIDAAGVTLRNLTAGNQVSNADTTHRPTTAQLTSRWNSNAAFISRVTVDDLA